MKDNLLFNGEYPIQGQIEISSPFSYFLLILLLVSIIFLFLTWYNHLKIKSNKIYNISNIVNPLILLFSIALVYFHSIIQQNIAYKEALFKLPNQISSDLAIRGFYISKVIPRFALIIGIIVFISMIPIFINRYTNKNN